MTRTCPQLACLLSCALLACLWTATPLLAQDADPNRRLVGRLASCPPSERLEVLEELDPAYLDPRLPALLEAAFADSEVKVRLWAARHLFARGDEKMVAWLELMRERGRSREVYNHATETLGLYARPAQRDLLAEALTKARDLWGEEVVALVGGLLRVGGETELSLAAEVLRSSHRSERLHFWRLLSGRSSQLRSVPGRRIRSLILAALTRDDPTELRCGARALLVQAGPDGIRQVAGWLRAEDTPRGHAALETVRLYPTRAAQAALASALPQATPKRLPALQAVAEGLGERATPRLMAALARTGKQAQAKQFLGQKLLRQKPTPEDWAALRDLVRRPGELRDVALRIAACRKHELPAQTLLLVGATDADPKARERSQKALGSCGMLDPRALREALPLLAKSKERSSALRARVSKSRPELIAYVFLRAVESERRLSRRDLIGLARSLGVIPARHSEAEALELLNRRIQSLR